MSKDSNDPLAGFRGDSTVAGIGKSIFRQISQSATSDQMAGDPHFYAAYGVGDRSQERLEIRRVLGTLLPDGSRDAAWHAPSYRYLVDVIYDGEYGTELVLAFSFLLVKIKGRNLQALNLAILDGTCSFIQEYHENEFSPPAKDAPVIVSIEVVVRGGGVKTLRAVGKESRGRAKACIVRGSYAAA